jgi:hypothetical protein
MDPSQPIFTNKNLATPKNWGKKINFSRFGFGVRKTNIR